MLKHTSCQIVGCQGKSTVKGFYPRGYCECHYKKYLKHGDPLYERNCCKSKGVSFHPLYYSFNYIKQRCYNPNNKKYRIYGERGIKVCDRWMGPLGFLNFLEDMGEKPSPKHSIDRINNDGDYEPSNCKWSTSYEQMANRRNLWHYPGVCWDKKSLKWYSRIKINKVTIPLGRYSNYQDAVNARKAAEVKYQIK